MRAARRWVGLVTLLLAGCGTLLGGAQSVRRNDDGQFDPVAGMAVTPDEALEKAEPYLNLTFHLRQQQRDEISTDPPTDHVSVKDGWYYIVRDNYPSYSPGFDLAHAVRVHGQTGQLLPPE